MFKIFLVEDDEKLCKLVKEYLEKYDYEVVTVKDFKNIEEEFEDIKPQLVLLDINLPFYDGFHLCRIMRRKSNSPIIFTSARSSDFEQIRGLELGADDYITKPYSFELLLAKVKASLRRIYGEYSNEADTEVIEAGLMLDKNTFKALFKNKEIELSKNEFKLLNKLLENKNKVVKREELLEELWDDSFFVDDNTLTVNVTRVKSKLAELGIEDVIKTKRGLGYTFDAEAVLRSN